MAIVPDCPNWKRGTCERSDPVVLAQDAEYAQLGCRTCRCGYVITMPKGVARARWTNELKSKQQQYQLTNADRVKFFGQAGVDHA